MVCALVNSHLKQISANFWKKKHETTTHLNCKPDLCEKTASFEKFKLEIELNFLENVNAQTEDRSPCYYSSIEYLETLLGVSNQDKTQALNYLSYS